MMAAKALRLALMPPELHAEDRMMLPLLAPDAALFLDIDGTLIDFVPRPEEARVAPALLDRLDALRRALDGALALVSGRKLADIDRLFAPLTFAAGGQHGSEARLAPGVEVEVFVSPERPLAAVLEHVEPFLARHPRVRIERKGLSTAFHYRDAVELAPELRAVLESAVAPFEDTLHLLDSHLCYDVRARHANKGKIVERFLAAAPFAGRVPVYVGDDWTDEDGFTAALAANGRAIRVGAPRPTLAREELSDPSAVRRWLEESLATLRR
jgi:trehalose 6-phosphate phosphatase